MSRPPPPSSFPSSRGTVAFAEQLVDQYRDAPVLEPEDWERMHMSGKEKKRILQKAFQRVSAITMEEQKSYTTTGVTLNRLDYGPILYRAYESCRSPSGETLTEEEAYHLFEWVIHSPARRGLERFSVRGLLNGIQEERTDTIQVVLYMQKMARRTQHNPPRRNNNNNITVTTTNNRNAVDATLLSLSSSVSSDDFQYTLAAVYSTMCEPSQKFALLFGRIDEAAVLYEQEQTGAFTRLVEEAANQSRANRTALMQHATMKLFGTDQVTKATIVVPIHVVGDEHPAMAALTSVESLLTCLCPSTLSNTTTT